MTASASGASAGPRRPQAQAAGNDAIDRQRRIEIAGLLAVVAAGADDLLRFARAKHDGGTGRAGLAAQTAQHRQDRFMQAGVARHAQR
ncbi:hypothetical protein FSC37_08410 [Piscinibacter aquaticus]|uniref:Uncharacterized protein n=1 Tax=Piscinibacter aquaticus TaxID=392597 RepID=A0A5C6TZB3_9BURK|nr:hypothetical protein FSC37_08410 [Piscinibacter aquaticus]